VRSDVVSTPPGRSACPEPGSLSQCFQRLSYLAWTKKTLFLEFGPGWTRGNRDTSLQTSAPGEVWIPHCAPHTGSSLYIKMGKDTLQVFYLCSLAQGDSWKNKCVILSPVSRILVRLNWQDLLHIPIQEKLLMVPTILCSVYYQVYGEASKVQEDTQLKEVIPRNSTFRFMPDGEYDGSKRLPLQTDTMLRVTVACIWGGLIRNSFQFDKEVPVQLDKLNRASLLKECSSNWWLHSSRMVSIGSYFKWRVTRLQSDTVESSMTSPEGSSQVHHMLYVLSQKVNRGKTHVTLQEGGTLIKLPTKEN
jgi:hypothetical protein